MNQATQQIREALDGARKLIGKKVISNVTPKEQEALYGAIALLDTHTVIPELIDGWDIYCIGRDWQNNYWIEVRHIESGKLCRDLGLEIYHAPTIAEAINKANSAIKAMLTAGASDE